MNNTVPASLDCNEQIKRLYVLVEQLNGVIFCVHVMLNKWYN